MKRCPRACAGACGAYFPREVKASRTPGPSAALAVRERASPVSRDRRLFERYRDPSDPVDRDALVKRFLPLAHQLARRFSGGSEPYEDLLQVASLALVGAIDRFDPDRRVAFSSYAMPTMAGAIKRYYRDMTWAVHVPRDLKERALAVDDAGDRLARDLGRAPSRREIAEAVRSSERQVLEAAIAINARTVSSLDLWYDEQGYERVERRAVLDRLLALLSRREREVLRLRFDEDLCQREIGERIGVSQMQVSRILRTALGTLERLAEGEREAVTEAPRPPRTRAEAAR